MILLGVLSIVQMVFLPGYLIVRTVRLGGSPLRIGILSFALSLVVNHFLVVGLVLCGGYRFGPVLGIFALEAALLGWSLRRWPSPTLADLTAGAAGGLRELVAEHWPSRRNDQPGILRLSVLAAAAAVMLGYAGLELARLGGIFTEWDAVVSWNRWAMDWAGNHLPRLTCEYPQLLPTNWSLSYLFLQDTRIWFFAKAPMPLFCVVLLLAIFDLYLVTRNLGYLLGVSLTYGLLTAVLDVNFLGNGYADLPVAALAFVAVYALLLARHVPDGLAARKYLLLGAVIAAGAALTKQAGLVIAAVYPALCCLILRPGAADVPGPKGGRAPFLKAAAAAVVIVALVAPWYTYKHFDIRSGHDWSAVGSLVAHAGSTPGERLAHAGQLLTHRLPLLALVLLAATVAFGLHDRAQRWPVLLVAVPFPIAWAIGFSYDLRNLTLAVPFWGVAAGVGIEWICRRAGAVKQAAR